MDGSFRAKVRPPTSLGWLASAVAVILTGELHRATESAVPEVFGTPMTPDQMLPWFYASAVVMLGCLGWLVSLYLAPGHLLMDPEADVLELRKRESFGFTTIRAPLGAWNIRLVYFSDLDQKRGAFKRIELRSPETAQVLLFGDVKPPDALPGALDGLAEKFESFEVLLEQSQGGEDAAIEPVESEPT